MQVAVNPDGGMTVGIEIAADHLVMVLVDLTGRVRADRSLPLKEASLEHIVPLLGREVGKICDAVPGSRDRLLGIGVVMPGPFDIEGMSSVGPTTLPGWVGKDPAKTLAEAIGISTLVENDATAAAVGERLHGVARTLKNFCLLYFGAGLGLGIVTDGRPMRGAFGNAGEIGHVIVHRVAHSAPAATEVAWSATPRFMRSRSALPQPVYRAGAFRTWRHFMPSTIRSCANGSAMPPLISRPSSACSKISSTRNASCSAVLCRMRSLTI